MHPDILKLSGCLFCIVYLDNELQNACTDKKRFLFDQALAAHFLRLRQTEDL